MPLIEPSILSADLARLGEQAQEAEAAGVDYVQLTFARTPWHGISWRFFFSSFYRSLAKREGRFRHIWFHKPAADGPRSAPPSS